MRLAWWLVWTIVAALGTIAIVRFDIAQRRTDFLTDAAIAHRSLSQRAAQHDAILEMLALLAGGERADPRAASHLPAVYPQIVQVLRRSDTQPWPRDALLEAEARSLASGQPRLAEFDAAQRRFTLVMGTGSTSYALVIDALESVPWQEWPIERGGPVAVVLRDAQAEIVVQPGTPSALAPFGLTDGFVFEKALASASQPFILRLQLATGPAQWPWAWSLGWTVAAAAAMVLGAAMLENRRQRRRDHALLRLGRVAKLNALGELAGTMAHELNQPLTAALANAQAAGRLLADEPPAIDEARNAMNAVAAQTRRAADVVSRLRNLVDTPRPGPIAPACGSAAALTEVLEWLEPQRRAMQVRVRIEGAAPPVAMDRTSLEQILHNLVANALLAMEPVPANERELHCTLGSTPQEAWLRIRDTGQGLPDGDAERVFEPFFTTRADGMGLGLSLSRKLAEAAGGSLRAHAAASRGATFELRLPLA